MANDPYNGMPDLAEMGMRGKFRNATDALAAIDIIRIIKETDKTPDVTIREQRAAVLTIAQRLIKKYATEQVRGALEARDWADHLTGEDNGASREGSTGD